MEVSILLAIELGVSAIVLLLNPSGALVIKDEPSLDTEYYVGPASYTRKEGKALPSTIIISRPIGLRAEPTDDEDSDEEDITQGTFSLVPVKGSSAKGSSSLGISPNIQFYKIECSSGRSCTSIIPMRDTVPEPPQIPFTKLELKKYLAQFGLYEGFPYNDDYENSGSPDRPKETHSSDRAFGSEYYKGSDYWPGSAFRPGNQQPSKAQVFKFERYGPSDSSRPLPDFPTRRPEPAFSTRRPIPNFLSGQPIDFPTRRPTLSDFPTRRPTKDWNKVPADFPTRKPVNKWDNDSPFSNDRFQNPLRPQHSPGAHELPTPFGFDDDDDGIIPPYGPPRPPPASPIGATSPEPYDGVWNRYSLSTVSQLDRETGKWVKVSSNSKRLGQGLFDISDDKQPSPPGTLPPATHHTKASLTVLGISDREPFSTFSDSDAHKPHLVKVPSSHPGKPPETIETDGGYVQSFPSIPLTISFPYKPFRVPPSSDNSLGLTQVSVPLTLLSPSPPSIAPLSDDPTTPSTSSTTTTSTTTSTTSTTTTTTTTTRPPITTTRTTTTTTTTQKPPEDTAFLDNPYAVMAAVGAGLIPATFAALLPVFVSPGKRRRRRRSATNSSHVLPLGVPGMSEKLLAGLVLRVQRALMRNGTGSYRR